MPAKESLQDIPGFSQGVRVNSAQRMVKMNRPICPHSKIEMEWDDKGRPVPKEAPSEQNCQTDEEGPEWWKRCEARGHDPYFRTRKWYTKQDRLEEQELDGRTVLVKTGEYMIPHEIREPNLAQVAQNLRINNGRGVVDARAKGFRRLPEAGFKDVCQFRNCQKDITKAGTSRVYGLYCSKEHLQLIAADQESILLTQGALLPVDARTAQRKRAHQLREISIGAADE